MTNDDESTNLTHRSGGADLNAQGDINVGGDVVGRDKIEINIGTLVATGETRLLSKREKLKSLGASKQARQFWAPFVESESLVVIGCFHEFDNFEPTGVMGVGDAIALTELRAFFDALDLRDFDIAYADRLTTADLATNLIVLGGPDANPVARDIASRLNYTIRFGNPTQYEVALFDTLTGLVYAPAAIRQPGHTEIVVDYGLILKAPNPLDSTKQVMFIAGSFGYGTWAGVRFITSRQFLENSPVPGDQPLECLIETEIQNGAPQVVRSRIIRPLLNSTPVNSTHPKAAS